MKKLLITLSLMLGATPILAENIDVTGTVQSRCTVNVDTPGYYGNPNAYTLTTLPASAGQEPIVRFDTTSIVTYGGGQNKAFPGGEYKAVVLAQCVAQ